VVSLTHRPHYLQRKKPPVPTEQEARSTPKPIWTFLRRENPLYPARNQIPLSSSQYDRLGARVSFILAECNCTCNKTMEINAFMP